MLILTVICFNYPGFDHLTRICKANKRPQILEFLSNFLYCLVHNKIKTVVDYHQQIRGIFRGYCQVKLVVLIAAYRVAHVNAFVEYIMKSVLTSTEIKSSTIVINPRMNIMERPQRASKRLKSAGSSASNVNDASDAIDRGTKKTLQPAPIRQPESLIETLSPKDGKYLSWTAEMSTALFTTLLKEKKAGS
jgi:hypothetical protein